MSKKISIQGIEGSFHNIAAMEFFGKDIQILGRDNFDEVFDDVTNSSADFGVIAIENSIAGSILTNYDLLLKNNLKIIGEHYLRIKMNLIAFPGVTIEEITEVQSHPMALLQCREFLNKYKFKVVEVEDTAGSVKNIKDNNLKNVAAIAGDLAAKTYDMNILAEEIETNKENFTRFLIIAREDLIDEGDNKASIMVELSHNPGSLFKFLQVFDSLQVNLTKIESRPILGKPWEYRFYIDFEQDLHTQKGEVLIQSLKPHTDELVILGSYKSGRGEN